MTEESTFDDSKVTETLIQSLDDSRDDESDTCFKIYDVGFTGGKRAPSSKK